MNPKAETIGTHDGHDSILFEATFSGGGSGDLTNLALLEEHSDDFLNPLPVVQLTHQSESKFWSLPQTPGLPILATAEFVWDFNSEQTHFGPHHHSVNVQLRSEAIPEYGAGPLHSDNEVPWPRRFGVDSRSRGRTAGDPGPNCNRARLRRPSHSIAYNSPYPGRGGTPCSPR